MNKINENIEEQEPQGDALTPEETEELDENSLESEFGEQDEVEPGSDEDQEPDDEPNYEEILEKERERLGRKIDKERKRRIEAERKSLSPERVEEIVEEKLSEFEKRAMANQVNVLASQLSGGNESLKELIKLHYENSIIPSGNVEEDVENAFLIATKGQIKGRISELKKAAQSNLNRIGGSGAGAPVKSKPKPKYSQEVVEAAKFAGVSPEEFLKQQKQEQD